MPERVFKLPNDQVALFLRHLWATDGSVRWDDKLGMGRIYYAATSRQLVDDVQQLLLRLGVNSRITKLRKTGYRDCWRLWIDRADNQIAFLTKVGVHGLRSRAAQKVLEELTARVRRPGADTVPKEVWARIVQALSSRQMTYREFAVAADIRPEGSATWTHAPGRPRLHRVAALLQGGRFTILRPAMCSGTRSWRSLASANAMCTMGLCQELITLWHREFQYITPSNKIATW
ncbi:replicative DNA helicase domain protein [Mycobacterium xenopi 4042]|uniref:Replicative DNA helicase domain protein n=1 Tax=Mycobacterium xenopi 4042 TaxID=1299334 RepID=X8CKA2_MYCXE|nr:replicative DNA helicase domain protein [Mycobacterium xenopi 4042]